MASILLTAKKQQTKHAPPKQEQEIKLKPHLEVIKTPQKSADVRKKSDEINVVPVLLSGALFSDDKQRMLERKVPIWLGLRAF